MDTMMMLLLLVLLPSLGIHQDSSSVVSPEDVEFLEQGTVIPSDPRLWSQAFHSGIRRKLLPHARLEFGECSPATLLAIPLKIPRSGRWWLVSGLRTPGFLGVSVGTRPIGKFGGCFPFSKQPIALCNLSIPLDLRSGEDTIYILAYERKGPCALELRLIPDKIFPEIVEKSSIRESLVIGYAIAVFAVAAFLWALSREKAFGWYAGYFLLFLLWLCAKRGFLFAFIWPKFPFLNPIASMFFALLAISFFANFVREILELSTFEPRLSIALKIQSIVLALLAFLVAFTELTGNQIFRFMTEVLLSATLLMVFASVTVRAMKGILLARQLLVAFSPVLLGSAFGILVEFGIGKDGPSIKATVMAAGAILENTLTTLIMVRELYRRDRDRLRLQRDFHRAVVERSDRHLCSISQELHDDLGQRIASLRMSLFTLRSDVNQSFVKDLDERIEELGRMVRDLSRQLHPSILGDRGLDAAVRDLCESLNRLSTAEIEFASKTDGEFEGFSTKNEIHAYRIVQESLSNAIKHGNPHHVAVRIFRGKDGLKIEVQDDGKGFEQDNIDDGLGITGIRSRTEAMEGKFHLWSHPGKGTEIRVEVPWKKDEKLEIQEHA